MIERDSWDTLADRVERNCALILDMFAEAGVQRVYLQLLDLSDLEHLQLFAAEVMPRFAGAGKQGD